MASRDGEDAERGRRSDPLQRRYRRIFDSTSVGLLETDLSELRAFVARLEVPAHAVAGHLSAHPEQAAQAARSWPIRDLNTAARKLLACADDGEPPASLGEVMRAVSAPAFFALLGALAEGASVFETELCLGRPGADRQVLVSLAVPRDEAELEHVVVSLLDLTERKRLERELWTAQRMEALGHLTGGVAHDFNNLLMVISSYAGFVMDQLEAGSPVREDVQVIREAAGRAAELTNQLLAFSSRQMQQLETLDLNLVVGAFEKMLRRVIGEHIELSTVLDPQLGLVRADRSQVEQILMNLAVNARDAMPGGGTLTLATSNAHVDAASARGGSDAVPPGSYVVISVKDSGVGMDAATCARVFDPFFTTKEQGRGSGLGLSTVYGIVKQSQGHIRVRSEPARGTTFEIHLPAVVESGHERRPPTARSLPPGRETVLLVEDEDLVRVAARRVLERHGYRVIEARDGRDALDLSLRHAEPIDLMVTDVVMPHMSGCELARELAELRPSMKVIFVSGYAADAIARHGALDPGAAFIQKPFTPDALLGKVRELLAAAG